MLHRSSGTSTMPSRPSVIKAQNASGESEPHGKRQPIPVMAIGSCEGGIGVLLLFGGRAKDTGMRQSPRAFSFQMQRAGICADGIPRKPESVPGRKSFSYEGRF